MARSIPGWLSGVVERLELDRPELVTTGDIARMAEAEGLSVPAGVIASRLRLLGWLLPTPQRGVWEFAPAEVAGAYSSADPLLPLKAFAAANPSARCALSFQSAAWALGLADRPGARIDVAFAARPKVKVPDQVSASTFVPALVPARERGVEALRPASVVAHMAQRPGAVRSWQSAEEWLPEVAAEVEAEELLAELAPRPRAVRAKAGYLLQGVRPDLADAVARGFSPSSKVRLGNGPRTLRTDPRWQVADTLLPFAPGELGPTR
jgi:hypothetical protein